MDRRCDTPVEQALALLRDVALDRKSPPIWLGLVYEAMAKCAPSASEESRPVAWRWRWRGGDEPDVWAYTEHEPTPSAKAVTEPLFARSATISTESRDALVASMNEVKRVAELVRETQPTWSRHLMLVWGAALQVIPSDSTVTGCIYEARSREGDRATGSSSEAWCRTHGWDCPNQPTSTRLKP
jgi:hypothetical protein